ncbi:MAG: Peptidase M23 [Candidatus Levybacteria bacterium GW2011_GWB1_36_18]|nr:MAG: Peptidase M23 [Candidatus Levybacteria bacterium GW2011_GWB1_36_18]
MKKFLLLPVLFLFLASIFLRPVFAETVEELQKRINDLQSKITELQGQGKTLSSQIAVMDNQINLTELKIASTEQQITDLTLDIDTTTKKIGKLEGSLDNLTRILINRIKATYIIGSASSFQILLGSSDVSPG